MFAYYLDLAFRSFKRNKALTALMVLGIALGIGAAMTTLTVFHVLSGDPLPERSHTLFYPQLDPRSMDGFTPGDDPAYQMSRRDAENLLRDAKGDRQAVMTGGGLAVEPTTAGVSPFIVDARYTSADFFPMFDTPFQYGSGWNKGSDDGRERVAVISSELNVRLQVWLAFGFLAVCLLNTVGLLLAKFLRRSSEIGVRRALGASRRAIFAQCLVEAGTIGLVGGAVGLGLALLGLWAVRQQPSSYAELAQLDPAMLMLTIVLAIVASVLAGLLPAWRACEVTPAIQLKSQ